MLGADFCSKVDWHDQIIRWSYRNLNVKRGSIIRWLDQVSSLYISYVSISILRNLVFGGFPQTTYFSFFRKMAATRGEAFPNIPTWTKMDILDQTG